MNIFLRICCILPPAISISICSQAQLPDDAFRLSWTTPLGTAREQAIGGAMGSLGGEISSLFINPAGLGTYKTNEFVLSPGFHFNSNNTNYRGTSSYGSTVGSFGLGATGAVISFADQDGTHSTLCIGVNQTANFKNSLYYTGQNNYSSYAEQFAEEFSASGLSINDAISSPALSYGTRMALYTYLIDTATVNGSTQIIALPEKAGLLNQQNQVSSQGSTTEVALGYAGNFNRRWFAGISVGVPIVYYRRQLSFVETDATGNQNNDFASSIYQETYLSKGSGVNLKFGGIFKATPMIRLGLAIHTPTVYTLSDNISASMTTNTENYAHIVSITSAQLDSGSGFAAAQSQYNVQSPWKFLVSGSYIFQEIEDVTQQRGFVTADVEYVTYHAMQLKPNDHSAQPAAYFDAVNSAIRIVYKKSLICRLGGELKVDIWAERIGFSYSINPYKQPGIAADRILL